MPRLCRCDTACVSPTSAAATAASHAVHCVQINPRISASMVIKSGLILSTVAASFYAAFFGFQSFWVRSLAVAT